MSRKVYISLALTGLIVASCLTPFQATDFSETTGSLDELTFYSEDNDILECYRQIQEEKQIEGLRLANHSDSKEEIRSNIDKYFERHGCALAGQGKAFVDAGIESNVDPYFIAAISIIESTGGNHCVRRHNAWGRKSGGKNGAKFGRINANGWCSWDSWENAIRDESDYIARIYLDQGRTNAYSIARKYCPPTASSWRRNVTRVQNEMASL